jgi:hypothetical protein
LALASNEAWIKALPPVIVEAAFLLRCERAMKKVEFLSRHASR